MSDTTAHFRDKTKFLKLNECLKYLFNKKYTRFSRVDINNEFDSETFSLACQIYKRGIVNHITHSKIQFQIDNRYKKPKIEFFSEDNLLSNLREHVGGLFFTIVDIFFSLSDKKETTFYIEATEKNKNIATVANILAHIKSLEHQTQFTHIIGIGGGITLDIAGFVASLTQKKLVLIPTTLLSMIDATIGGKTGVNFEPYGKNQVGSFYFADKIIITPHFLKTLPHHEIVSGLCEALKHSWIAGNFLEHKKQFDDLLHFDHNNTKITDAFILDQLNTKMQIVTKDPYEKTNYRSVLNFGHTIGHALETSISQKNQKIPHGIAVAHGMLFVLKNYYQDHTHESYEFMDFLRKITTAFSIDFNQFSIDSWAEILLQDKKNKTTGMISICLPEYGFLKRQRGDISHTTEVCITEILKKLP